MNELSQVEQLLNEVQTISQSYDRVAEATGENFNIFTILQMETDEVATHSRFLAELLNIKGRHGQKEKFLNLFVKQFAKESKLNTEKSEVIVEFYIGKVEIDKGGRIDILIKDNEGNIIMIENKIYAIEQLNQLNRYHNKFPTGRLLYLTLFGDESRQHTSKDIYDCISYETDIINWLEECKKEAVNIPILRETISQYINLLKKLTNQNLNIKMSQDVVKRVLRDENSFKAFKKLLNSKNEVFKIVMNDVLFPLLEDLEKRYSLKLNLNKNKFLTSRKAWVGFNFVNDKLIQNNLRLNFEFQGLNYSTMIFGFTYIEQKNKHNFNYDDLKSNFKLNFGNFKFSDAWPCYNDFSGYTNWLDLDTLQKIKFGDFKNDITSKIEKMLEIIENN